MDPAKMKVVDLRSELGALGLDTKGNKAALVERLKKALETKTGKSIADTTILDTSTEDAEDTPKRPGPAARTRRRSSSARLASTPAKHPRRDSPEAISEDIKEDDRYSPGISSDEQEAPKQKSPEPQEESSEENSRDREQSPIKESPRQESPPKESPLKESPLKESPPKESPRQESPPKESAPEKNVSENEGNDAEDVSSLPAEKEDANDESPETKKADVDETAEKMDQDEDNKVDKEKEQLKERKSRFEALELTEEEEWEQLNERLKEKEKERIEREKKQAEDDAKKLEEVSNDPIKFKRFQRKHEKKQRWNNFYRNVEVTNEILTPPTEEDFAIATGQKQGQKGKKEGAQVETKLAIEPELDESKITLSWYDSDLNQYLMLPGLNEVMPMNEGAFAHAWAGARATHGVASGRVCYEVKVGSAVTTTEAGDKEPVTTALRIGWSTDDQSLHLGEGERSWAYESTGRAVNNCEFKEFGKEFTEKDVIGVYVDLESSPCNISYTHNGVELGVAFEFEKSVLDGKALFPHVLTKNMCYRVNLGHDRYNMLTKTKIVRNRLEIPIEQVLEEKRVREEELQRQKDEVQRREKERRDKEKQERMERQRKKREERQRVERERKEREAAEKRERGEDVEDENAPEEKDIDPKENGDKPAEPTVEVKVEPCDVEMAEAPAQLPVPDADQPPPPAPAEEAPAPPPPVPAEEAPATDASAEVKEETPDTAESAETPAEVTEEQIFTGHVLDKRIKFVIRHTADEELDGVEACLVPGYVLISLGQLVPGPVRPASIAECEVYLMVGMPGSGKTHWVKQRAAENPEKRYNILSTGALFEKMKVDCKPLKATYEGRWDAMVSKCAKCVLKLLDLAHGRRRNFILDQTNVYPSAQRRKLREFEGYRRIAVAVVTDEETYKERCQQRETADGKEVPDPAILDMKANFCLPEKSTCLEEVIFPDLNEEEAKKVIEAYHKEAKAAGVMREREKRERSAGRDAPQAKRQRSQDKRHGKDDRGRSRDQRGGDREDRWGGGNRWGGNSRGGGNRWGRDRSGSQNSRFSGGDRWGGNNQRGGDYGSRDRDNFRGGSGGRQSGPPGGRGPGPTGGERFNRDRGNRGPSGGDRDKRPQPPALPIGGAGGAGGGSGSWQRGGQIANSNRGGPINRGGGGNQRGNQKDGLNQNQNQQQQGWNQWAGGWGGWGNWNQNQQQGWNNWQNWQNWNQASGQGQQNQQGQQSGGKGAGAQQGGQASQQQGQWPANYTAQQWYQWQQWQQQQQNWAGYQQGGNQPTNAQDAQNAWTQYYQSYGNAPANPSGGTTGSEKKS